MAKFSEDQIRDVFAPHLEEGETVQHMAFGVKQPNIFLIILLVALAILPGLIAVALLTRNYLIATTERRFIVLQIKGFSNPEVKEIIDYTFAELGGADVKTSTGGIFTHINVNIEGKRFVAKFHRAYSKFNRPGAMAIAEAISSPAAGA